MSLLQWTDAGFLAQLDRAFADSARRSGPHLLCRAACNQCCTGIFAISMLDMVRLQCGFDLLCETDPLRASRVRDRVSAYRARLAADYPGEPASGLLSTDEASEARFEDFANEEVCPVLDPRTGTCDLYASRPVTCRVFGPPSRHEDGLGICELCFQGATEQEIAAAEMVLPAPEVEAHLTEPLGDARTTIGFGLQVFDRQRGMTSVAPGETMLEA